MAIELKVASETGKLKSVIIGYPHNFHECEPEIVNESQRKFYSGRKKPTIESLVPEFEEFNHQLKLNGVIVYEPVPVENVPDQLTPRDIGFIVGGTFVVAGMAKQSRKQEWEGISRIIEQFDSSKVIYVPEGIILEGGDVIVDKGCVYVGLSQRSTMEGVNFLRQKFPNYDITPVHLKSLDSDEDVLHLDCAFVPVGNDSGIIYPQGFIKIPRSMELNYSNLIGLKKEEQKALASNVLSLSAETLMSRKHPRASRLNSILESRGLNVIKIKFDEAPKTGGSFRCCSLPLYRE